MLETMLEHIQAQEHPLALLCLALSWGVLLLTFGYRARAALMVVTMTAAVYLLAGYLLVTFSSAPREEVLKTHWLFSFRTAVIVILVIVALSIAFRHFVKYAFWFCCGGLAGAAIIHVPFTFTGIYGPLQELSVDIPAAFGVFGFLLGGWFALHHRRFAIVNYSVCMGANLIVISGVLLLGVLRNIPIDDFMFQPSGAEEIGPGTKLLALASPALSTCRYLVLAWVGLVVFGLFVQYSGILWLVRRSHRRHRKDYQRKEAAPTAVA